MRIMKTLCTLLMMLLVAVILQGCAGQQGTGGGGVFDDSGESFDTIYSGQWIGYGRCVDDEQSPVHWCHIDFGGATYKSSEVSREWSGTVYLKTYEKAVSNRATVRQFGTAATVILTDPSAGDTYVITIAPGRQRGSEPLCYEGIWNNNTTGACGTLNFSANSLACSPVVNENRLTCQGGSGPPVIFVHGMTGSEKSWINPREGGVGWIPWLQQHTDFFRRHTVYLYQYDWQLAIENNGSILVTRVADQHFDTPPLLVGHSMGCLVLRSYIAQGGGFSKLVELAGPNHGSPLANEFWLNVANLPGQGPRDLNPDSEFLKKLNTNPIDMVNRKSYYSWGGEMKGHFDHGIWVWDGDYSALEKLGNLVIRAGTLDEPNDGRVTKSSALLDGTQQQPFQTCDHVQFLNPELLPDVAAFILSL